MAEGAVTLSPEDTPGPLPPGFVLVEPIRAAPETPPPVPEVVPETVPAPPPGFAIEKPEAAVAAPPLDPAEPETPGFLERAGEDLEKRGEQFQKDIAAAESGETPPLESALRVGGTMAGAALDVIGQAVVSVIHGVGAVTPDVVEDPVVDAAKDLFRKFMATDVGKAGLEAVQKGADAWAEFSEKSPNAARNIESLANIALLGVPVKGKPSAPAGPTLAGRTAERVEAAGVAQTARQRAGFVDELVLQKQTAKVKTEQVARTTEEGLLTTKKVGLSTSERRMAEEVDKVAGVSSEKTLQGNYNAIAKEVNEEAGWLKTTLDIRPVLIPRKETAAELARASERLAKNPTLVGDAEKSAAKIVGKMQELVAKHPGSASGLLAARKELDSWIGSQRPKVFDPAQEGALSIAVREIRQSMNNLIDARATNVAVKDSFRKQSTLLSAMENIAPKAAAEAGNVLTRAWQNASKALGVRTAGIQVLAAAFGIGGLGAAAAFAPVASAAAAGIGLTYVAGRAVLSARGKKHLALLLRTTDRAIRKTKDKALIAQLRADRGAIVALMKQTQDDTQQRRK